MHNGYSDTFGGGQAVMRDFATGVNYGASDPRKDGAAVPELPAPSRAPEVHGRETKYTPKETFCTIPKTSRSPFV